MRDDTVGYINTLMQAVREDGQLTQDAVGQHADLDKSSICRCELGEREIIARHVRALGCLTRDRRLVAWMFPWLTFTESKTPERIPPAGDVKDLIHRELEAMQTLVPAIKYVNQIISDGKIDGNDDQAIANLAGLHEKIRDLMTEVDRAVAQAREGITRGRRA
jgi:hypothetical protein